MKRLKSRQRLKRAAVAVEMAVVTPVLLTMLFGIIEFGWLFTVRSTMVNAAREGARLGSLQGVTAAEIVDRTNELLVPMHLEDNCSVSVEMPTEAVPNVTVTVSAARSSISLLGNFFNMTSGTVSGSASMRREGL